MSMSIDHKAWMVLKVFKWLDYFKVAPFENLHVAKSVCIFTVGAFDCLQLIIFQKDVQVRYGYSFSKNKESVL